MTLPQLLEFSQLQERLNQLDALLEEGNVYRLRRIVNELRRSLKMHSTAQAVLREEAQSLRKEVERLKKQAAVLQAQADSALDGYQSSLLTFEKFRAGIRIVESMRDHEDLPGVLERIRALFQLKAVSLILDHEAYRTFVPEAVRTEPGASIRAAVAELIPDPDARPSFLGALDDTPNPEFFFGQALFANRKVAILGSCFICPLKDKYAPGRKVGVIGFLDSNPRRYTPDKLSDFLEHFCDILSYSVVDITDRKKAENLREDVERMTRHDLKSPLTAVLTLPQLFKREGNLSKRQEDMLDLVQHAGYRMLNMINQSLDLYRMESGSYDLTPTRVDLLPILDNIAAELRGIIEARDLDPRILVDGRERAETDAFVVRGEEMLLYTMFSNLIKNALEASDQGGGIVVGLSAGRTMDVVVKNSGAVPAEVRPRFFEKYVTAGKKDGTGLGTYGAKLIAQTHGATIAMTTSEAEGTTVTVSFPVPPRVHSAS